MNEQLDEGRIVDKIQFNIKESDTAEIIHEKNKFFIIKILKKNLKNIYKNKIFSNKQKKGTYHSKKELKKISLLEFSKKIKIEELFRIIRGTKLKIMGIIFITNIIKSVFNYF